MDKILWIDDLNAFYGDFQALFGVGLQLAPGEVLALIGANGAGKSSLLRSIAGLTHARAKNFRVAGQEMIGLDAPLRARAGIALCPEGRRVFASLTVAENLLMGARIGRKGPWGMEAVCRLFPILKDFADRPAALLSGGQQQMVAIGRALMANPAVLLLDEVSLGLAPVVADEVHAALAGLRGTEMAIILVEQDITRALRQADSFLCLLEGRVALQGSAQDADLVAIGRAYFGEEFLMIAVDTVLNGLMLGGLYALFGLGLSLIFGVMRIANIAHGELVVGGAFMAFSIAGAVHVPPILLVVLVTTLMFGLGWVLQAALVNRVMGSDPLRPLLVTFGVSIMTQNLMVQAYGADSRGLDVGAFKTAALALGPVSVGVLPAVTFVLSLGLFGLLHWALHHTDGGRVVRATSDDPEIVGLMGVNRRAVFSGVMALSAALAALAGMLLAMRTSVTPFSGAERLLIAFEVVVIGGLGSIWASLAGGLALGLVHAISFRADPASGLLYGHILLLAILLVRPEGLAGKRRVR